MEIRRLRGDRKFSKDWGKELKSGGNIGNIGDTMNN
jgi:hypothetical protein